MISNHQQGDHIYLVSSDGDLIPAIQQLLNQAIKVTYVYFQNKPNQGIKYAKANNPNQKSNKIKTLIINNKDIEDNLN